MSATMTENADRLLNTDETAALVRLKPQTLAVWRSHKRGGPAYVKVGSKVFYKLSDVLKWLETQTVATGEAVEN